MPIERVVEGQSIVLVGSFNPAIFHPSWLGANKLVRATEAESAAKPPNLKVVSSEFSALQVGAFSLQVTTEQFVASTADLSHSDALRDLVFGIFSILEHTPAHLMGLNRQTHFRIENETRWHEIGHRLVPKDRWAPFLLEPGTAKVSVAGRRPNSEAKRLTITAEPSGRIVPGVFVSTNEHYEVPRTDGVKALLTLLQKNWGPAQAHAAAASAGIIESALKG